MSYINANSGSLWTIMVENGIVEIHGHQKAGSPTITRTIRGGEPIYAPRAFIQPFSKNRFACMVDDELIVICGLDIFGSTIRDPNIFFTTHETNGGET